MNRKSDVGACIRQSGKTQVRVRAGPRRSWVLSNRRQVVPSAIGGLLVVVLEGPMGRETALRMPWFVVAVAWLLLFAYAAPKSTTQMIPATRPELCRAAEMARGGTSRLARPTSST